jgi:flagellar biosynthesis anti-sigma factor FlgM
MKINVRSDLNTSKPQSSLFEATKPDGNSSPSSTVAADRSDGVDLGNQSELLSQAQTAGAAERASQVERLRALVQSGQYNVDPVALSQSIVAGALKGF